MSFDAPRPGPGGQPWRVLLVEDEPAGRTALARVLELHGFVVSVTATGTAALEALGMTPSPDILLTDLNLPDLDGREICLRARLLPNPPLTALITGWGQTLLEDNPARWGIDILLDKPLELRSLLLKLEQSLARRAIGRSGTTGGP